MVTPTYEIFALKYAGPLVRPASMVTWFQDIDKMTEINYYIFAIRGGGETIIVDCGVAPKLGAERNLNGYENPAEVLKRIGIDAEQAKHVVVTHIHFDHISGAELFPQATFYVQEKEFLFWMKNPIAQKTPFKNLTDPVGNRYLADLKGTKRLRLIRGSKRILPGIELIPAPGHTVGLQVVAVNTAKGTAVVGSDLAHLFGSYRTDIPSAIITDMIGWMKSFDKIRAKASSIDLIFPGHDPALLTNYPKVAEGVSQLV